jgi:DNA-binding transcriptional ArsR family regulator
MVVKTETSPFGSRTRTRVLSALHLLEESYARELARVLAVPLAAVQKALHSLERDGIVAARARGRTRIYRFEPRHVAREELRRLVGRLAETDRELATAVSALRRRPRKTSKPL